MHTEELQGDIAPTAVAQTPDGLHDHAAVEVSENRIYVWSSPAPYAVVIQESRSFHRHI